MSNPALDMDNVERTTEALAEVMSNQEEVDNAIRTGGEIAVGASGRESVDDDELKKELEEMVRDEKERQRVENLEAKLAERAKEKEKEATAAPEPTPVPAPASAPVAEPSMSSRRAETTPHIETDEEGGMEGTIRGCSVAQEGGSSSGGCRAYAQGSEIGCGVIELLGARPHTITSSPKDLLGHVR